MGILLDTHLVLDLVEGVPLRLRGLESSTPVYVSVASLWEIAMKMRLGKLRSKIAPQNIEAYLTHLGATILPIETKHVVAEVIPQPLTRDPFDRLLLAVCSVDGLRLATVDRALADHPLALGKGQTG